MRCENCQSYIQGFEDAAHQVNSAFMGLQQLLHIETGTQDDAQDKIYWLLATLTEPLERAIERAKTAPPAVRGEGGRHE